jgi:hypothetical protein
LAEVFEAGYFLLKGGDGHDIKPSHWAWTVQPDSTVELQPGNYINLAKGNATRTLQAGRQTKKQGLPVAVQPPTVEEPQIVEEPRIAEEPPKLEDTSQPEASPNRTISGAPKVLLGPSSPTKSLEKPKESTYAKIGGLLRRKR